MSLAIGNHSFWKLTVSVDWTSSHSSIFSNSSSIDTLSSSTTHPTCSLFIPKATGTILGSAFQTRPSTSICFTFSNSLFKSVSCSYTFTSNTTIDLAAGFFLGSFLGSFLGWGAGAGALSSPNRSSSSAAGLASVFLSSLAGFSSFFPCFFPPLKASWVSLGRSAGPTSGVPVAIAVYQLRVLGYFFLWPSPNRVEKTTETELARERSAMLRESPTRNFFSANCFSTKVRNLLTSSMSLAKSTFSPQTCLRMVLVAGSKSQAVMSSHWSTRAWWCWLSPPQRAFLWVEATYLAMVLEEKIVPSGVSRRGRVLKKEILETSSPVLCSTSSTLTSAAAKTDLSFLMEPWEVASALKCSFIVLLIINIQLQSPFPLIHVSISFTEPSATLNHPNQAQTTGRPSFLRI